MVTCTDKISGFKCSLHVFVVVVRITVLIQYLHDCSSKAKINGYHNSEILVPV